MCMQPGAERNVRQATNHRGVKAHSCLVILALVLLLATCITTPRLAHATGQTLQSFRGLVNAPIDATEMAVAQDVILHLPDCEIKFTKGIIYRHQPVMGNRTGFYFTGTGELLFAPSDSIEASILERFGSAENEDRVAFEILYSRCADFSHLEFDPPLVFAKSENALALVAARDNLERWLTNRLAAVQDGGRLSYNLPYAVLYDDITNGRTPGSIYLVCGKGPGTVSGSRFYRYETLDREQIAYNGWCRYTTRPLVAPLGILCQQLDPHYFDVQATIDDSASVEFDVEAHYALGDSLTTTVCLDFSPEAEIEEIRDESGHPIPYWVDRSGWRFQGIQLFLPEPHYQGDSIIVHFAYSLRPACSDTETVFYFPSDVRWLPTRIGASPAAYDLFFSCPDKWKLISSGKRLRDHHRLDKIHSYWVIGEGATRCSFVFGDLQSKDYFFDGVPPTIIGAVQPSQPSQNLEAVLDYLAVDAINSLAYFQRVFGRYPFSSLHVVEVDEEPASQAHALIQLPTDQVWADPGSLTDIRRAYGVASQWWQYFLDAHCHRDLWLLEGLTEYAAALYVLKGRHRDDQFRRLISSWQEIIVETDRAGDDGPLWLGTRLPREYLRAKGAYVLHMLRMMMTDLSIESDRRFMAMMRDFLEYYRGQDVSTYDFRHECELYFPESLDWFFQQWIYGSDLPTYTCRHVTESNTDGTYLLWLEVTQSGVPEGFRMPVPVTVIFRGRPAYRQLVNITGKLSTIKLGPFHNRPERVIFNDFGGVLSRETRVLPQLADGE